MILPCNLPREDVRDVYISFKANSIRELSEGAVIGSASLRRQAQILAKFPHLKVSKSQTTYFQKRMLSLFGERYTSYNVL